MTDGGSCNGRTVKALGLTKVASIEYEAMTSLLTSAADYNDLHDALQQACADLVGTGGITLADCRSVREAVKATEMERQPLAGGPRTATTCPSGSFARSSFFDDFEDTIASKAAWDSRVLRGSRDTWYYPQNTNNDPDRDGTWASSGVRNLFGDDPPSVSDSAMTMVTGIKLPTGTPPIRARLPVRCGLQAALRRRRRRDQRRRRGLEGRQPIHRPVRLHRHHHHVDRQPAQGAARLHRAFSRLGRDASRPVVARRQDRAHPVPDRHGPQVG